MIQSNGLLRKRLKWDLSFIRYQKIHKGSLSSGHKSTGNQALWVQSYALILHLLPSRGVGIILLFYHQVPVQRPCQSQCQWVRSTVKVFTEVSSITKLFLYIGYLISLQTIKFPFHLFFRCFFFFLTFNDLRFFELLSCKLNMHQSTTRIPSVLIQYNDDADSSVCLKG